MLSPKSDQFLKLVLAQVKFPYRSGLYLSPLSAHEHSERSIHYGPSQVVHIENFAQGKYILGKFDKWVSCDTVNRRLFFFWGFGDQPIGFENDPNKALDYTWFASKDNCHLYGSINDDRIKKVEVALDNGTVLAQTNFYDDLFLFTWKRSDMSGKNEINFKNIKGYDSGNNLIFKSETPS